MEPSIIARPHERARPVLVDAHVHLHGCFSIATFLNAASANFSAAAARIGLPLETPGCLLLAESAGADAFGMLREIPEAVDLDGWRIQLTDDATTLLAERSGDATLWIIAGRQIATSDGLEVLALLTTRQFPAAILQETIDAVRDAGALPVIPWGFGKWTLRRRAVVERALRDERRPLFIGDNGGRARIGLEPTLFASARSAGLLILPGSDPLPFEDQQERAGSYGFVAALAAGYAPAAGLRQWLLSARDQPRMFGRRERTSVFVRNQIRMQLRKRRSRTGVFPHHVRGSSHRPVIE